MKDSAEKVGMILDGSEERDAIHFAIAPVVAGAKLYPGQDVGFLEDGNMSRVGTCADPIGIVDPFLKDIVMPSERFFLFLYPLTITSLRHEWTHPAFEKPKILEQPDAVEKWASEKWMKEFASKHFSHRDEYYHGTGTNYTADELIDYACKFLLTGNHHVQQGSESLRDDTVPTEFWRHFEVITGTKVPESNRDETPFGCTC